MIAGVDEVGRGPLAGPVVSAAVILGPDHGIIGLTDSKKLSAKRREELALEIKERAVCWAIGRAEVEEIDRINILQASLLSMSRAVAELAQTPEKVLVDGNKIPELKVPAEAIVKGDLKVAEISAASIIAKVSRDHEMMALAKVYPQYGFDRHMGYPTQYHMNAIEAHGICDIHRRSYAPIQRQLDLSLN